MAKRGANLDARLGRLEQVVHRLPMPGQFNVVQVVSKEEGDGRAPGLYSVGPSGSTAGLLVYDPAHGEPAMPPGRLARFGLMIVLGVDRVEPPLVE